MESVAQTTEAVKKDVKETVTTKYLVSVGVGLAVLFATVWVVGKAWRKSQKA
jgi:multisubunit Na+/H+ antiporter MnhB subunit